MDWRNTTPVPPTAYLNSRRVVRAAGAPLGLAGVIAHPSQPCKTPNWITRENICLRSLYRLTSSPAPIRLTMLPWALRPAPPRPSYSLPKTRNRRHYGDEAVRVSAGIKELRRCERWSNPPPSLLRTQLDSQSVIHPASHAVIMRSFPWSFSLPVSHPFRASQWVSQSVTHRGTPQRLLSVVQAFASPPRKSLCRGRCEKSVC